MARINTNTSAQIASRLLNQNQEEASKILRKLSSGIRINVAGDDAAGFAIAERLSALSNGLQRSELNLQDSSSAFQVAEGGLATVSDSLQRLRQLSVQSANDTLSDDDRAVIQEEVDQLTAEIDRQTQATQFNGQQLLTGNYSAKDPFTTQAGGNEGDVITTTIESVSAKSLGVDNLDISTRGGAEAAISSIDAAINQVSQQRASIGSSVNRIEQATAYVGIARENTLAALSRLRDTEFASSITEQAQNQIRSQSNISALAQANLGPRNVLQLLK